MSPYVMGIKLTSVFVQFNARLQFLKSGSDIIRKFLILHWSQCTALLHNNGARTLKRAYKSRSDAIATAASEFYRIRIEKTVSML